MLQRLLLKLNNSPEPNLQTLPSSLELLLNDSWSESETLIFSNAHSISVCFFFFYFMAFFTCFCTMMLTSCLVNLFFSWKSFPFFTFKVVHLSVLSLHVSWYWRNVLPLCSSSESLSLESLKVTPYLFSDPLLDFFLFLERTLGDIDFSRFLILVLKNSAIE